MPTEQHHHHHDGCCGHDHDENEETAHEIVIHKPDTFLKMREAGRIASEVLDFITPFVKVGVTTNELDKLCYDYMIQQGVTPACLGYRGYPKTICTSVNHVVCHGIPSDKKLQTGDILNIDITIIKDGWFGDTSRMFKIGKVPLRAEKLINVTYEAMMRGIEVVKPGVTLGDIGHAIQSFVEKEGFSVVRDFCGHGIGQVFHAAPNILHYGKKGHGLELREGMFFTIEPMINGGGYGVKILEDGWTAVTRDRSLSAQFEHTLGVTAHGNEIFT
jgi:methionyl aminopeptidase